MEEGWWETDSRKVSAKQKDFSDASQCPVFMEGKKRCLLTSIAGASIVDLRDIYNVKHTYTYRHLAHLTD